MAKIQKDGSFGVVLEILKQVNQVNNKIPCLCGRFIVHLYA